MIWRRTIVLAAVSSLFLAGCGDPENAGDGSGGTGGGTVEGYSCVQTDVVQGDVTCRSCMMNAICTPPTCAFASSTCTERGYTKACTDESNLVSDWFVEPGLLCASPLECTISAQCQQNCCLQSGVTGLSQCRPASDCTGSGGTGGGGGTCPYNDCTESPYTGMRYMCVDGRCVCKPHCQPIGSSVCCGGSLCAGDCIGNPCCS